MASSNSMAAERPAWYAAPECLTRTSWYGKTSNTPQDMGHPAVFCPPVGGAQTSRCRLMYKQDTQGANACRDLSVGADWRPVSNHATART